MRDHYWRRENFETLSRLAFAAEGRGLAAYATYCRLRERGLRGDALAALRAFVAEAVAWPLARRAEVTEWLLALELAHPRAYDLVPQPLRVGLVEPTLAAWAAAAPGDPGPWRWLPAPDGPRRALALEPGDQVARFRLAAWAAGYLEYATHELPAGYLGGHPGADRALAEEALAAARGLADPGPRDALSTELAGYAALVESYAAYSASHSDVGFAQWVASDARPHA